MQREETAKQIQGSFPFPIRYAQGQGQDDGEKQRQKARAKTNTRGLSRASETTGKGNPPGFVYLR